jgi:nicotinamidase-related amidase
MRIIKDRTAALLIDVQERIFPAISEHQKLEKNIILLLEGLKSLQVPVFVTEQYVRGLGPTIPSVTAVLGETERVEKAAFSCCDEARFMVSLAASGKENVIVFGVESHVCVLQTVIDLAHNGYHPIVVEDCVSSRSLNDKQIAIARMRQEGAIITTYESILFELLRFSGTEQFKAISRLVK